MSLASRGRLIDLVQTPLTEVPSWVAGGILPKSGVMLLGGPPKIGKTFIGLEAADNLTMGEPLWGCFPVLEAATVLYIDQEVGAYGIHDRTTARMAVTGRLPSERFHYATKIPNLYLDTNAGKDLLIREIEATEAQIVIIDPISKCIDGNENDNPAINKLFLKLMEIQSRYQNLSYIIMHHFGKPPRDANALENWDPLSAFNFRGAGQFFSAPDTLLMMQRTDQGLQPGERWRLQTGWELRQAATPEDAPVFAVCDGGLVRRVNKHKLEVQKLPIKTKSWGSG